MCSRTLKRRNWRTRAKVRRRQRSNRLTSPPHPRRCSGVFAFSASFRLAFRMQIEFVLMKLRLLALCALSLQAAAYDAHRPPPQPFFSSLKSHLTSRLSLSSSKSSMGPTALIYGSTGAVGSQLMRALSESSSFAHLTEAGRRSLNASLPSTPSLPATFHQVDFDAIEQDSALAQFKPDVVFITLGTTYAIAGSASAFRRIDQEYVINGARAVRTEGRRQSLFVLFGKSVEQLGELLTEGAYSRAEPARRPIYSVRASFHGIHETEIYHGARHPIQRSDGTRSGLARLCGNYYLSTGVFSRG